MILLLEGADVAGKTTLGDLLERTYKEAGRLVWRAHHSQHNNSIEEFSATLHEAHFIDEQGGVAIIDRLWISEMIYGPIMRKHTNDPRGIVARLAHLYGVITIMCVREDLVKHVVHFRQMEKTRDEYAGAKIESIIKAMHELWYGKHDVPDDPSAQTLARVIAHLFPLRMLRSYYQYDMDKFTPQQYVSWLMRMEQ